MDEDSGPDIYPNHIPTMKRKKMEKDERSYKIAKPYVSFFEKMHADNTMIFFEEINAKFKPPTPHDVIFKKKWREVNEALEIFP